jgi:hypothetical protein
MAAALRMEKAAGLDGGPGLLALKANAVKAQGVIGECEMLVFGYFLLEHFNGFVLKLLDPATLNAYEVVVMIPPIKFKNRVPALKVVADHEAGSFKLSEHAINGGKADFFALGYEMPKNFFRAQVAVMWFSSFENLKNFDAGKSDFQARVADVFAFQGVCSVRCFKLPYRV